MCIHVSFRRSDRRRGFDRRFIDRFQWPSVRHIGDQRHQVSTNIENATRGPSRRYVAPSWLSCIYSQTSKFRGSLNDYLRTIPIVYCKRVQDGTPGMTLIMYSGISNYISRAGEIFLNRSARYITN